MIDYRESDDVSKPYKEHYVKGIEALIGAREQALSEARRAYCKDIFSDGARYRDELKKMLGWPLVGQIDTAAPQVKKELLFNTRDKIGWSDRTWFGSAEKFDDAEIAAPVYPRKLCIEIGTKDELFPVSDGIRSYERLKDMCRDVGTDWLSFLLFDGKHEFCRDNVPIEALVKELSLPSKEIPL